MPQAHILLVEDDAMLRSLIEQNLVARGYRVCCACAAEEALACLRAESFDLVLLDINLSEHTGWDVLRIAQQEHLLVPCCGFKEGGSEPAEKLPVVILSAVRVSPHRLAEFHPLAYLPKPFPMDALLRLAANAAAKHTGDVKTSYSPQRGGKGTNV